MQTGEPKRRGDGGRMLVRVKTPKAKTRTDDEGAPSNRCKATEACVRVLISEEYVSWYPYELW